MNRQDNVPQVKSVEQPTRKELSEIMMPYIGQSPQQFGGELQERCYPVTAVIEIVHEYAKQETGPLHHRISELEAALKYSELKFQIACEVMDERMHEWTRRMNQAEQALNSKEVGNANI